MLKENCALHNPVPLSAARESYSPRPPLIQPRLWQRVARAITLMPHSPVALADLCGICALTQNRRSNSGMELPRGVTVTQRPLEALFLVRIQAG